MAAFVLLVGCTASPAQDSGGVLLPEQAAYDVFFYDLALTIQPGAQAIAGTLTAHAAVQDSLRRFVLDLDSRLDVDSVQSSGRRLAFAHRDDRLWIDLRHPARPGDTLRVAVSYHGQPRVAPNPPWEGGFTWAETPRGRPWIATSVQTVGADLWWPVKDHPSDEPDSMALHFTVPRPERKRGSTLGVRPLVAVSNGRLRDVDTTAATRTYHWFVSTPINNYGVALNVAPYRRIDTTYVSTAGTRMPVAFWALPGDVAKARRAPPGFLDQLRFLEETLGPYPFRTDKYGVVQTPFLGMEHQTLIAYGHDFTSGGLGYDQGFDALHFHELAHEWYGNLVTAADWKDFWIHEGFATYLEALYAEHLHGKTGYRAVMDHFFGRISGDVPIARRTSTSAQEMYHGDVYFKGAAVLHTLRYLIGDEAFFEALRRTAYPTASLRRATEGRQTRLVSTADFIRIAEEAAGRELDWFFDVYLYEAELPRLIARRTEDTLRLRWEVPGGGAFPMPISVQIGGETRQIAMTGGEAAVPVEEGAAVVIDPANRVLTQADLED